MSWAVVGAGYTGIAMAAALLEAGLEVEVLDRRPAVGGLWLDGVYDSVQLITTRKVTAFEGRPMPAGRAFPSGDELLAYLTAVAEEAGVLDRFRGGVTVEQVVPADDGWLLDGRRFDGVVLATGLFQRPRRPSLGAGLTIPQLHTADYRNASQLGERVLVVGLGNSGADVAHDAVKARKQVTMAVRRSRHVVPKRVLGVPVVELRRPLLVPDLPMRVGLDLATRALSAYWRRGKLSEPRHLVLSESPVVHSALLPLVAKGSVAIRPGVQSAAGSVVIFADGTEESFDTVVWATGYDYSLPVDRALVDGGSGPYGSDGPALVGGAWSAVSRGLAVAGLREPRHGRGPYLSALARFVAAGAAAQGRIDQPVGAVLARLSPPSAGALADDGPELGRIAGLTAAARRL